VPGTYSQILLHIVFSTKHREPWITAEVAVRLYPYIGGIEDHVHMYLRWRPDATVSDLMRTVKARSSKWVHDTFPALGAFAWQEGYSVFTVSRSQEGAVKAYIAGQHEHNKKEDFKAELLRILRAHGVEFDEQYVFDCTTARSVASSAPPGAGHGKRPAFHGFRFVHLPAGFAVPVATFRRPVGAKRRHLPAPDARAWLPSSHVIRRPNDSSARCSIGWVADSGSTTSHSLERLTS